jgi:colanic acid/amylovoran biosynthesis glycosyltransferase
MILVLFTTSYPYIVGGEQNFVEMEGKYLLDRFERVIVVPEKRTGARVDCMPGFELDDSYADFMQSQGRLERFFRGLCSKLVYAELRQRPGILLKAPYLERLIFFAGHAELTRRWLIGWLHRQNFDSRECLLYTYWFTEPTLGLGLAKQDLRDLRLVTRAHRYDLYEEVNSPPYWPCRESALEHLDAVFSVSEDGTQYLRRKYPRSASRVETARLGIEPRGVVSQASQDGVFRIVSCSKLVPVKRVDLLMQGIAAAAARRPSQRFEWCHIGNGVMKSFLEAMLPSLPANLAARIVGYAGTAAVFDFYRDHPCDVFVNVSTSEGIPVAIMEAISCGIPVIATAVGGTAEIVSEQNGCLISADASPGEIADALLADWDALGRRRLGSREVWESMYNAHLNYQDFVRRLVAVRQ